MPSLEEGLVKILEVDDKFARCLLVFDLSGRKWGLHLGDLRGLVGHDALVEHELLCLDWLGCHEEHHLGLRRLGLDQE